MELSDPEKEMRIPGSSAYKAPIRQSTETLDHGHHLQPPEQKIQPQKSRGSDPDRFAIASTTIAPISIGSKLKTPEYRECLKNHAANIGGNITDGCGEFMPSGDDGTLEALKCAACNCHRNFHRKEPNPNADFARSTVHPLQLPPPLPSPSVTQHRTISLGTNTNQWTSIVSPVKMAFGGGSAGTDSSSEELNFNAFPPNSAPQPPPFALSKKRFRTKFTQEQKGKMLDFAEKVGWRIPKEDDAELQRFCGEIEVKRQVLKVWMHNNKNSVKKPSQESNGD